MYQLLCIELNTTAKQVKTKPTIVRNTKIRKTDLFLKTFLYHFVTSRDKKMGNTNDCPCLAWWEDPKPHYHELEDDDVIGPEVPRSKLSSKELSPRPPSSPERQTVPSFIPVTPTASNILAESTYQNITPVGTRTPTALDTTPKATPVPPSDANIFRQIPDKKDSEQDFDLNSSIFKGTIVQQKFFNKSTYDPKFVWVNISSRALCLSEHTTKERRHKEANLSDITGVIAGPPEKYRAQTNAQGDAVPINADLCLSIKFVRGGGIDLQFQTTDDRDLWYLVIIRLIAQEREYRRVSTLTNSATK